MMKHAIVIDKQGFKVEFVIVDEENNPQGYALKDRETLVFDKIGDSFNLVKAKWTGTDWIEVATPEEIEKARPKQISYVNPSEVLTKAVFELKMDNMKKDAMIQNLGGELAKNKLEIMQIRSKITV